MKDRFFKIKPLEWVTSDVCVGVVTSIGSYYVFRETKKFVAMLDDDHDNVWRNLYDTLDEAKEACQKDYENRLLKCLVDITEEIDNKIENAWDVAYMKGVGDSKFY